MTRLKIIKVVFSFWGGWVLFGLREVLVIKGVSLIGFLEVGCRAIESLPEVFEKGGR